MTATIQQIESQTGGAPAGFAALLRRDREEAGLSLEMLAHKMETSPAYLFRLEKGTATNPGRNFTIRLGIALYRDDIDRLDQLLVAAGHMPLMTNRSRDRATERPKPTAWPAHRRADSVTKLPGGFEMAVIVVPARYCGSD